MKKQRRLRSFNFGIFTALIAHNIDKNKEALILL